MRISDWSSDVCSSDLTPLRPPAGPAGSSGCLSRATPAPGLIPRFDPRDDTSRSEERRVGKECVIRVDLGGRRIIKKKNRVHHRTDQTFIYDSYRYQRNINIGFQYQLRQ